jgi:hypothetical protein
MRGACLVVTVLVAGLAVAQEKKDDKKGTVVTIDGLSSRAPAEWKEGEAAAQFRFKQFTLPKAGDDKADAELIIFYFGPGGGGGVDANVKRWQGMFENPKSDKQEFKVGDVKCTYVDLSGTYLLRKRPFDQNEKATPMPGYRMLAVVFDSPKGPYFMRLVGPEKTVAHHKKGFDEWLKNFK